MLPFVIEAGLTPAEFFFDLVPRVHPYLVDPSRPVFRGRYVGCVGAERYTVDFDGAMATVQKGSLPGESYATFVSDDDFCGWIAEASRAAKAPAMQLPSPAVDASLASRLGLIRGVVRIEVHGAPPISPSSPAATTTRSIDFAVGRPGEALALLDDARYDGADLTIRADYSAIRQAAERADPGRPVELLGKRHLALALGAAFLPFMPAARPPATTSQGRSR